MQECVAVLLSGDRVFTRCSPKRPTRKSRFFLCSHGVVIEASVVFSRVALLASELYGFDIFLNYITFVAPAVYRMLNPRINTKYCLRFDNVKKKNTESHHAASRCLICSSLTKKLNQLRPRQETRNKQALPCRQNCDCERNDA